MKRKSYLSEDLRVYLSASVCAAHINGQGDFRQKDVRFYADLFCNWMDCYLGTSYQLQNTQIQRYLDYLVEEKIIKKTTSKTPSYQGHNQGLLKLISQISSIKENDSLELFYFQFHILELYRDLLFNSAMSSELSFREAQSFELKYLLDGKELLVRQKQRIRREMEKLKIRKDETLEMVKLTEKLQREGKGTDSIIRLVEQKFPYQLNNQISMAQLFKTLRPGLKEAELTTHAKARALKLWQPLIDHYEDYLKRIEEL
ncbi:MAG: hypothetical protein ACLGHN_15350 [Bacteriovoracia bacterium]